MKKGLSQTAWIGIAIVIIIVIVAAALMMGGGGETTNQTGGGAGGGAGGGGPTGTFTMYTGSSGGVYYPVGTKIAQVVTAYTNLTVNSQESGASVANANAIKSGDTDFAIMQSDVAYFAYNGLKLEDFDPNQGGSPVTNLRALAALYPEPIQIIARADAGVQTIWDLPGKSVAVGNVGSGLYATAETILSALTVNGQPLWDQITKVEKGYKDAGDDIKAGNVQVFFNVAGVPTPTVQQMAAQVDLVLVEVPDDAYQQLVSAGLGNVYVQLVIPANSYDFQPNDVKTLTVKALLVASANVPNNVVYTFLDAMFSHLDEIRQAHARAADISLQTALEGVSIPLHPGAVQFYQDKGLTVPQSLLPPSS
ncbi:MAG: TAXI family TRAP transporter solute-binding subunit [Desulfurococcales archaeon]|nr:TAXI family TRAP transporter solute-binding subunit [Desulfurococcales archaeon]